MILDGFPKLPAKQRTVWVFQIGTGNVTTAEGERYDGKRVQLPWGQAS